MPTLVYKTVGHSTATTSASEQRPHHQHQQERQWPPNERQEQPQQRHKSSWPARGVEPVVPFHHHQSAAATASALHEHSAATAAHFSVAGGGAQPAAARPMHTQQQAVPYHYHHRQSAHAAAAAASTSVHSAATAAHYAAVYGAQQQAAARPMHTQQAVPYHHHHQDRHFGGNYSFEYSSSLQQHHQPWHSNDNNHGAGMSHHHHYQQPPQQHPHPNITPPPPSIHHATPAAAAGDCFSNISDIVIQEQIDRAALEVAKRRQLVEDAQSARYEVCSGESWRVQPTSLVATTVVTPPGPYPSASRPSPQSLINPSVSGYSYGMDHPTTGNKHHSPFHQEQQQQRSSHTSTHQPVHVHVHVHPKISEKKARSTKKSASPTTTTNTCVDEHEDVDGDTLKYDLQYDIPPSLVGQGDQYQSLICNHVARGAKDIMHAHPNYSKGTAKAVSIRTKVLSKKKLPKTKKSTRPSTTSTIPISPISSHRKNKEAASTASSKKKKGTSPSTTTKTTTTLRAAVNTEGVALKQAIPLGPGKDDRKFLGEFHCFIRNECIEIFSATNSNSVLGKREAPHSVKANQIGIRCRFCAYRSRAVRKPYSTGFPKKVCNIYNIAAKMGHHHSSVCPDMPPDIRERYNVLKAAKNISKRGTMQHWIESAHALGLVDTESGVRMAGPVASPESQA